MHRRSRIDVAGSPYRPPISADFAGSQYFARHLQQTEVHYFSMRKTLFDEVRHLDVGLLGVTKKSIRKWEVLVRQ